MQIHTEFQLLNNFSLCSLNSEGGGVLATEVEILHRLQDLVLDDTGTEHSEIIRSSLGTYLYLAANMRPMRDQ